MKKLIQLLFVLLFPVMAYSQMTVGPRFGINFSQQDTGSPYETVKVGTMIGGVLNIPVKNDFAFQTGLYLTQKGYRLEFDGNNSYDELTSTYLQIPAYLNYFYDMGRFKPFGNIGFYTAFWKSGNYESLLQDQQVLMEDYEFTEEYDQDGYKDNRIDYGVSAGLGLLYDRTGAAGNMVLEFTYDYGLAPVGSTQSGSSDNTRNNSTFTISFSYMFYL